MVVLKKKLESGDLAIVFLLYHKLINFKCIIYIIHSSQKRKNILHNKLITVEKEELHCS